MCHDAGASSIRSVSPSLLANPRFPLAVLSPSLLFSLSLSPPSPSLSLSLSLSFARSSDNLIFYAHMCRKGITASPSLIDGTVYSYSVPPADCHGFLFSFSFFLYPEYNCLFLISVIPAIRVQFKFLQCGNVDVVRAIEMFLSKIKRDIDRKIYRNFAANSVNIDIVKLLEVMLLYSILS